jgi:hypothetical protein
MRGEAGEKRRRGEDGSEAEGVRKEGVKGVRVEGGRERGNRDKEGKWLWLPLGTQAVWEFKEADTRTSPFLSLFNWFVMFS